MKNFHPYYIFIIMLAYIAVILDIGVFANWSLLGGSPHLIPLFAIFFLVAGHNNLGLIWIATGSAFTDLIFSYRFGMTMIPLLLGFLLCYIFLRHIVNTPSWWIITGLGLFLVAVSQLPLLIVIGSWSTLPVDLAAAVIVLVPISLITSKRMFFSRIGLRVSKL